MSKPESLKDILVNELRLIHSSEKQLIRALPLFALAASSDTLRREFMRHLDETKEHAARIETMMEWMQHSPAPKRCKPMEKLIQEALDLAEKKVSGDLKDASLIATGMRIAHFEVASYDSARVYASVLGLKHVVGMLQPTLEEEIAAAKNLAGLALRLAEAVRKLA